uniref:Uncharacterized protein n=1 Tax=Cacopsylla melanoneura TaxID=428564 RepID=A0A8D9ARU5_9HEMI
MKMTMNPICYLKMTMNPICYLKMTMNPICYLKMTMNPICYLKMTMNPICYLKMTMNPICYLKMTMNPICYLKMTMNPICYLKGTVNSQINGLFDLISSNYLPIHYNLQLLQKVHKQTEPFSFRLSKRHQFLALKSQFIGKTFLKIFLFEQIEKLGKTFPSKQQIAQPL